MPTHALMKDGNIVALAAKLGQTPADVIAALNRSAASLTGVANTMDGLWLETADGDMIRYRDVDRILGQPT